ncbi:MAG: AraC family transcriptional regulator N-terminal domain-containing protein [Gammaproteobacteria bacterium]|nr:AraC family transcriptional regulator N-terminal domain-containing protein [Gammaproteobacteria bacterium]
MRSIDLNQLRTPQKLVENRISFAGSDSELSIYDTYDSAVRVGLNADQLLYCGMVSGRKVMHDNYRSNDQLFLPHESFVMAPGEYVEIDFPEATLETPTTCLTIEIAKEKVESISQRMADLCPLESGPDAWQYNAPILHTHHTAATQSLLKRMVALFTENHPDRDAMVELNVSELIIRMLRNQERQFLLEYCKRLPDASGMTTVLNYIEQHLAEPLDIELLTKQACMSRSRLYTEFKKQLGCSPCELQQQLRLKEAAKRFGAGESITKVCYDLGFSNLSHFSRRFRQFFGKSPREYLKDN